MIDFEHVTKQYKHGEKPALEDINFHVDDGEFVFLLGHSGAGKSTLLKLILREERATSGQVLVDGKDVAKLRRHPHGHFVVVVRAGAEIPGSFSCKDWPTTPARAPVPKTRMRWRV